MRGLFALVLVVGMGLAGFAVYMVKQQLEEQDDALARERALRNEAVQTVDVYSPNRAFTYGEEMTPDDVVLIKYAKNSLPEGVVQTEEALFPENFPASRVVALPMLPNEPIMESKLAAPGSNRGLTALVDPGMRAFPISGRVTGGLGTLRPQDRIDLYWTGRLRSGREVTNLLKSSLRIIAVMEGSGAAQNVVLQVTPEEVALLTQAQSSGQLTISLIGSGDAAPTDSNITVDNSAITGEQDVVVQAPVVEEVKEICYRYERRGTERVPVEEVPCE